LLARSHHGVTGASVRWRGGCGWMQWADAQQRLTPFDLPVDTILLRTFSWLRLASFRLCFFFFQAEDGIRDFHVTGVQTCALPICFDPGQAAFDRRVDRLVIAELEMQERLVGQASPVAAV